MKRRTTLLLVAAVILASAAGVYWHAHRSQPMSTMATTGQGNPAKAERKILYYRNPMGLPDRSPSPKKDSMGMEYIPVYADEATDNSVYLSPGKVQRSGVKTETVGNRAISRAVRSAGIVEHDESLLTSITVRSDGYVEDLFVDKTGQSVKKGDALFRFYSPQIQLAQVDFLVAMRSQGRRVGRNVEGAIQRLRNLGVPEDRMQEMRRTKENPRTLNWPSPTTGLVTKKSVINGQFVEAGDELFRIADHSHMWVIAEVAEADIGDIAVGTPATVTLRAFPNAPQNVEVDFIYPAMRKLETRTVPVRIVLPNEDGRIKPGMYADVVFRPDAKQAPVTAVPASAIIDSGTRKIVLIAKGGGRFEPHDVKIGRTGNGYVEVLDGVKKGDEVVTAATFLIDSESNLRAALRNLDHEELMP